MSPFLIRLLAAVLILGSGALRIAYLASPQALDLSADEAHYWDWSRHLDWSYYSKGPLVAYLIRGSCELTEPIALSWTGQGMLAVRLPAVVCGGLLLLSLYILTALVFRRESLALAMVAIALTLPPITAMSEIMTIDAPYICCWSWALVFGYLALFRQRRWAWPATGLAIALGILAKQTMVLWIPSLVLFLLFTPGWRRLLLRPGFWVMTLTAALGGLPMIFWNAQHDWVTFKHLATHAGDDGLHWLGPLSYVGTQFALFLGYWFVIWCCGMWVARPWKTDKETRRQGDKETGAKTPCLLVSLSPCLLTDERDKLRYLWWMSLPMFLFFLAFSIKNGGGEPNWPATAYLSGLVLSVGWLTQQLQDRRRWYRLTGRMLLLFFCGLGLGMTLLIHYSPMVYPLLARITGPATDKNPMPIRRVDPTCRLRGWSTLSKKVDELRQKLHGREFVIAAEHWSLPGEIAFYCQGRPTVYSLGPLAGDRHSQYDFWKNPVDNAEEFKGDTFIFVGDRNETLEQAFDGDVEEEYEVCHEENGQPVSRWKILVLSRFRGAAGIPPRVRSGQRHHY